MEIDSVGTESKDRRYGIEVLGSDQILLILQFLPASAIVAFGMTCHRLYDIANSDDLWAKICRREWGDAVVEAWPKFRRRKVGWKQLYGEMIFCGAVAWHQLSQGGIIPPARASHSMNLVAGKIAVFGGGCEGGRDLGDTWVASLPGNILEGVRWQRPSIGIPSGRFGHSCIVVDDMLVLFGGINDNGIRHLDTWVNEGLHVSSSPQERSSWRLLEVAQSPLARGAHASCYAGGKRVIVFGGIRSDGVRLQDTWILDLSEDLPSWREVYTEVSPSARSGHTLTWIDGNRMILFGGRGAKFEVLNDVWLLDLEGDVPTWTELRAPVVQSVNDAPAPRAGHSASLIFGSRILIFGGEDAKRSRKSDAWVLDPDAGLAVGTCYAPNLPSRYKCARKFWKKLKVRGQPPSRRSFHGACSLDSGHGVLIFGGMVDCGSSGLGFNSELYLLQLIP